MMDDNNGPAAPGVAATAEAVGEGSSLLEGFTYLSSSPSSLPSSSSSSSSSICSEEDNNNSHDDGFLAAEDGDRHIQLEDNSFFLDNVSGHQSLVDSYFESLRISREEQEQSRQKMMMMEEEQEREKTIRFSDSVIFTNHNDKVDGFYSRWGGDNDDTFFDALQSDGDGGKKQKKSSSSESDTSSTDTSFGGTETDTCSSSCSVDSSSFCCSDDEEEDANKKEERQIIRSLMYAGVGAGLMGFVGWGFNKLMNRQGDPTDVIDSCDVGTGVQQQVAECGNAATTTSTPSQAAAATSGSSTGQQASMNVSMTASQGNMSTIGNGVYVPGTGMEGAQ